MDNRIADEHYVIQQGHKVLTKNYVVQHGVEFEAHLSFGGAYGQQIVFYDENNDEHIFSGLAYDLYPDGSLEGYLFIDEGLKDGANISFYSNGLLKRWGACKRGGAMGLCIDFYDNGQIKMKAERFVGRAMTYIEFDEDGNIIDEKTEPTESDLQFARNWQDSIQWFESTQVEIK